jgi:hypothetical protein
MEKWFWLFLKNVHPSKRKGSWVCIDLHSEARWRRLIGWSKDALWINMLAMLFIFKMFWWGRVLECDFFWFFFFSLIPFPNWRLIFRYHGFLIFTLSTWKKIVQ